MLILKIKEHINTIWCRLHDNTLILNNLRGPYDFLDSEMKNGEGGKQTQMRFLNQVSSWVSIETPLFREHLNTLYKFILEARKEKQGPYSLENFYDEFYELEIQCSQLLTTIDVFENKWEILVLTSIDVFEKNWELVEYLDLKNDLKALLHDLKQPFTGFRDFLRLSIGIDLYVDLENDESD